ncbi:MAG TPA: DUF2721 domain-containing protein [Polyangia bacterium]|nr:DUF2721 domain-containing protein [Polyangia bacterium]
MPSNPFALLSLVGAPAVLTNAASVLALSTSNRFLRSSERMRGFAAEIDKRKASPDIRALLLKQMERTQEQGVLLLGALTGAYVAAGAFTAATLISILGAAVAPHSQRLDAGIAVLALAVGILGAAALIVACKRLLAATRSSVVNMSEEAAYVREHQQPLGPAP